MRPDARASVVAPLEADQQGQGEILARWARRRTRRARRARGSRSPPEWLSRSATSSATSRSSSGGTSLVETRRLRVPLHVGLLGGGERALSQSRKRRRTTCLTGSVDSVIPKSRACFLHKELLNLGPSSAEVGGVAVGGRAGSGPHVATHVATHNALGLLGKKWLSREYLPRIRNQVMLPKAKQLRACWPCPRSLRHASRSPASSSRRRRRWRQAPRPRPRRRAPRRQPRSAAEHERADAVAIVAPSRPTNSSCTRGGAARRHVASIPRRRASCRRRGRRRRRRSYAVGRLGARPRRCATTGAPRPRPVRRPVVVRTEQLATLTALPAMAKGGAALRSAASVSAPAVALSSTTAMPPGVRAEGQPQPAVARGDDRQSRWRAARGVALMFVHSTGSRSCCHSMAARANGLRAADAVDVGLDELGHRVEGEIV